MTRKDFFFLSAFLIAPFFFLSGTLTSSEVFFMRDLTYLFHPWRTLSAQMVQAGTVPLWNPYEMGGMPFLANCQSAILYPWTILFHLLEFATALKVFHGVHYALAGAGFYLLCRKLGLGRVASFLGGMVFAFNGYMLTRMEFLSVLGSGVWLPWILLLCLSADSLPIGLGATALGLVLAMSLFAGYPQILILQGICAVCFSLWLRPGVKTARMWAVALAAALCIGAAQWIPTLELMNHSTRAGGGITLEEAATYSLPVDGLFGLIYPFRMLNHPDRFTGEKFFWIWSGWWGVVASLLIAGSLRFRKKKLWIFSSALGAAGLLWSMGDQFPWFEFLHRHFFLVRMFRYPPVALYWSVAAAALLAALGAQALEQSGPRQRGKIILCFIGGALLIELWFYSLDILPKVVPDYYHVLFKGVESVVKDRPGTVMLSPTVNAHRRLAGMTSLEAKMRFRAYFFDLTNLPYRICTIIPSGEPLALASYQKFYAQIADAGSLEGARPILNFSNVTHLLSHRVLDKSWTLVGADRDIQVYRNPRAMGEAFALTREEMNRPDPKDALRPSEYLTGDTRAHARFEFKEPSLAVFSRPFYPGWKIFSPDFEAGGSNLLPAAIVRDYFLGVFLPAGSWRLFLVYDSIAWKAGAALSALALCFAVGLGLYSIRRLSLTA